MTTFLELHQTGTFLLVNVHDAGAAVIAQSCGAIALGTTSSGHAYTLAQRDAVGSITKRQAIQRAAEICAAVDLPVSVDAENGWGHTPEDVASTIRELADIGAAGASIEDWSGDQGRGLYDHGHAVARIQAAVETAKALPDPFVVCARAEALLHDTNTPLADVVARLQSFAEAGAHCVYAPGPQDSAVLKTIVDEVPAPVNALIGIGSHLTMGDAQAIGVRRVSLGGSLYRATMTAYAQLVTQAVETGSFETPTTPIATADIERLFADQ